MGVPLCKLLTYAMCGVTIIAALDHLCKALIVPCSFITMSREPEPEKDYVGVSIGCELQCN